MRQYLKKAFKTPWNLLFFFGGLAAAALSPFPDVALPLVGAAELMFLGGLVSIPRFRDAVDAEEAEKARQKASGTATPVRAVADMVASLGPEAQQRFIALRKRCLEMRSIAKGASEQQTDLWTPALDRLLYGFLRLLGQQHSLNRFLRSTTDATIESQLGDLKKKLDAARASGDDRMIHSLAESVAIAEQRLDNYRKAVKNAEFASLELDRVEAKIQALIELAANRQDMNMLSSQVDAAADSMHRTETAMGQLQQIEGMDAVPEEVPAILDQPRRAVTE